MKTLLIAFSLLALTSCEICEECTTTTTSNTQSTPLATTTTEICGRKEIKQAEGTTTSTSGSVVVKTVTNCR